MQGRVSNRRVHDGGSLRRYLREPSVCRQEPASIGRDEGKCDFQIRIVLIEQERSSVEIIWVEEHAHMERRNVDSVVDAAVICCLCAATGVGCSTQPGLSPYCD